LLRWRCGCHLPRIAHEKGHPLPNRPEVLIYCRTHAGIYITSGNTMPGRCIGSAMHVLRSQMLRQHIPLVHRLPVLRKMSGPMPLRPMRRPVHPGRSRMHRSWTQAAPVVGVWEIHDIHSTNSSAHGRIHASRSCQRR
jgi:hypothetical protein